MTDYTAELANGGRLRLTVTDNGGSVSVVLKLERTSGGGRWSDFTNNAWSVTIDGAYSGGSGTYDLRPTGSQTLIDTTFWPARSTGATRTISVSGSFNDPRGNLGPGTASGTFTLVGTPSAPTGAAFTQQSPTSAALAWSPPASNAGSAVTGYRVQHSTSPTFASPTTIDIGNVTSYTLNNLIPGSTVYARVYARNAAGIGAASATATVVLVTTVGDLDGWAAYGTLPAGLTPLIGDGLRRGSVYPLGASAPTGLLREIQATGSGAVAAAALGIQRTIAGLKVGATYRLAGTMLALTSSTPPGNEYRFSVDGIGAGANGAALTSSTPVAIPTFTFVATATEHVIRIQLNEAASWSGSGWFEAVAFYGITLTEIPNTSPYRLQDVVYEGPLSTHFSIACDTLAARWWVDRAGVTQFRQADSQDAILATFTDDSADGALEYVGIGVSFNTRDLINVLKVTNHGRDADTGDANDLDYAFTDDDSIEAWGPRSSSVDMSLYVPPTVDNIVRNPRAANNITDWQGLVAANLARSTIGGPLPTAPSYCRATLTSAGTGRGLWYAEAGALVKPSRVYTGSVWVRSSIVTSVKLDLVRYTAASGGSALGTTTTTVPIAAGNTWQRITFTFTTESNAAGIRLHAYFPGSVAAGTTLDVTAWTITEGSIDTGYYDGDTPAEPYYSYAWAGPAHASPSTRTALHLERRTDEIFELAGTPHRDIRSILWNAQEDPQLASRLDIQSRVRVQFRGEVQDCRIVGIKHTISGTRWMVELTLERS